MTTYDPEAVRTAYDAVAAEEDQAEKRSSLRTEIPRTFIKKYLKPVDVVLDAGGGTGINAVMMARRCRHVTLVDLSPKILALAAANIEQVEVQQKIELVNGDITDLTQFEENRFSFGVCVGDSISYVLDKGPQALQELVRVVKPGSILIVGCDSKYGFMRLRLSQGLLDEAIEIEQTDETYCGMGPRTRLYTVAEMRELLHKTGCELLEVASTPTFTDTIDSKMYQEPEKWAALTALEMKVCTRPELLGMGLHLLFVAQKRS